MSAEVKRCLCGKVATWRAYLPIPNIFAGLRQVLEEHFVCNYHAMKARDKGFEVEKIV